ncbi:hypothetical protein MAR_003860 [Mya arenaria]|uniref:Uncharacterized protein n=1 Tax=Mya arenaria TaxID=6604 RepID=A0ABY7EV92_MYAAR|nr:hypothetical protein MAR_003860 [Mya arenaria]
MPDAFCELFRPPCLQIEFACRDYSLIVGYTFTKLVKRDLFGRRYSTLTEGRPMETASIYCVSLNDPTNDGYRIVRKY